MKQVVVDGSLINYTDTGRGPTLLCVHGWMHGLESFQQLTEAIGPNFRVISLDLPNFGGSQVSEDIYSIDGYGKFLASFVTKLKLKNYILVGHSMGGQISIRATARHTLAPQKLILLASAGVRDNRKVYKIFLKSMSKIFRHIMPKRIKNRFYAAIDSDYNADLSEIHKKVIAQTLSTDIQADAHQLKLPVLLVYGSKDASTPLWMGQKLEAAIAGSKLEVIDGENHWLHQTSAEKTAKIIKEFISV